LVSAALIESPNATVNSASLSASDQTFSIRVAINFRLVLDQQLRDEHSADSRSLSNVIETQNVIANFKGRDGASPGSFRSQVNAAKYSKP